MEARKEVLPIINGRKRRGYAMIGAGLATQSSQALMGSGWFISLGKMSKGFSDFFQKYMPSIFLLGFVFSLASWIIGTLTFSIADNKNLDKSGTLIYSTLNFLFYFATGIVFLCLGKTIGMPMLLVYMFSDPVVNLGKSIYYLIRTALTSDKAQRALFLELAKNHGIFGLGGAFISAAFTVLMLIPALPVAGAIVIGAVGIAVILSLAAFTIYQAAKTRVNTADNEKTESKEMPLDEVPLLEMSQNLQPVKKQAPEKSGYYNNTITKMPASWKALEAEIKMHKTKVQDDLSNDKSFFAWFEAGKRQSKIHALTFYTELINDLKKNSPPAQAEKEKPYELAGYLFNYKDKNELSSLIRHLVLEKFPDAFQSFSQDVGKVEDCFNRLILCMMSDNMKAENEAKPGHAL